MNEEGFKGRLFGLSYRGKRDMCLLFRDLCLKQHEFEYVDVATLCKIKREAGECKYAENVEYFEPEGKLLRKPLLYSELLQHCKHERVCPYRAKNALLLTLTSSPSATTTSSMKGFEV